jgi:hypothetical protein
MEKTRSLADVGEWKGAELGAHGSIRNSYANALTAAARLFSFATGAAPTTDGPVADQQEALAADDLVAFAIHARRLIDNTISLKRANKVQLRCLQSGEKEREYTPITRVINVIIHHSELRVFRSQIHLRIYSGQASIEDLMRSDDKTIDPICIATSDKEKLLIFEIRELVETFQKGILGPVIDLCGEHHLWLDEE